MFSVIGYLPIDEGGDGPRVWRFWESGKQDEKTKRTNATRNYGSRGQFSHATQPNDGPLVVG